MKKLTFILIALVTMILGCKKDDIKPSKTQKEIHESFKRKLKS